MPKSKDPNQLDLKRHDVMIGLKYNNKGSLVKKKLAKPPIQETNN